MKKKKEKKKQKKKKKKEKKMNLTFHGNSSAGSNGGGSPGVATAGGQSKHTKVKLVPQRLLAKHYTSLIQGVLTLTLDLYCTSGQG